LRYDGVINLFKVLTASGTIGSVIDSYPKMKQSKDAYLAVVDEIMTIGTE